MKKILIASVIAGLAGAANAQSAFDGPFVQLNVGGVSSSVKNIYSTNAPSIDSTVNGTSFVGQAVVGYSKSFNELNLAANVFYNIGNQSVGDLNSARATAGSNLNLTTKFKNTYGIAIEPGYNFNKETLGYLKLAYVSTTLNGTDTYTEPGDPASTGSSSTRHNGIGYGVGAKRMVDKNIFIAADVMYTQYQSKSNSDGFSQKPSQMSYMVGVGYKF